ncbi:MAG: AI-2E family transporter [Phycisphaerae bacterium]|nr:AI-2E family transporter [Phycisphaerae bacterium]
MELDLQRFYNLNRRAVMWIVFFAILFLLRDFFALVFLTFIFGFLMRKVARFAADTIKVPYWAAVSVPYLLAVGMLALIITIALPRVVDEGFKFSKRMPVLFHNLAEEVQKAAPRYNMEQALARYVIAKQPSAALPTTSPTDESESASVDPIDTHILAEKLQRLLLGFLPSMGGETAGESPNLLADVFRRLIIGSVESTLDFLLAILLSFLIVLDYDRITHELHTWRESPVGRFFHEATASLVTFSGVVGSAFQCQMAVALLNASITCIGLFILGIQPLVLLTTIVFLLGLIPVLGVFISSVPIILISFNDYSVNHTLLTVGMIVIVHLLEAYVFNPRIYAARFHLNPVMVLIILLVGEKLFGAWGMLLGIPVTHYVLNIAQVPATVPRKLRSPRRHGHGTSPNVHSAN